MYFLNYVLIVSILSFCIFLILYFIFKKEHFDLNNPKVNIQYKTTDKTTDKKECSDEKLSQGIFGYVVNNINRGNKPV